jgi:protein SCO1/2
MLRLLPILLTFWFSISTLAQPNLKNYSFKDSQGRNAQLHDIKGSFLFISFIYTRCPVAEMCPLTMTLNKQLFKSWKRKAASIPLKFLIVTLDPSNDTPATLKAFGEKFGVDSNAFLLLTGEDQTISDFASEFNALGFPSSGLVSHNSRSVLVSPELVPLKDYKENEWKPETVLKDLVDFHSKQQKKS